MDTDKLSKIAKQAEEVVLKSGVSESFKVALFEKTFSLLAEQDGQIVSGTETPVTPSETSSASQLEPHSIKKLVEISRLTEEKLLDIYDFTEKGAKVITAVLGGNTVAKKQQEVVLLHLLANYYCYGKDREDADVLRLECEDLGIVDSGNFSKNIAAVPQLITAIGKKGSAKKQYKITVPGKQEALRRLSELNKQTHGPTN